ncbi:cation-transporting P-type ATPase [Candidatus Phytoplasma prunorum]|uniref:cation-transporting P-type ATPase n=1 Tax=Candidatus Phytoplasma prunorum TaxID=47565 RepID=UPI002FF21CB3
MKKKSNKNSSFNYVKFMRDISQQNLKDTVDYFNSNKENGMTLQQVIINRKIYGGNEFVKHQQISYIQKFIKFFLILLILFYY